MRLRSATGHGLCGDEGLVAERLPAFLGEMRHHRREAMDEDVAGLGEGGAQIVGDRRLVDRADRRAELVGEFVDRGDADIEAQPLDLVLDLGQRRVRDPADALRLLAIVAGGGGRSRPTMRSISQIRRQRRCVCLNAP